MKTKKTTRQTINKTIFRECLEFCQKYYGPIVSIKFVSDPIQNAEDLPTFTQLNQNDNCEIFGVYDEDVKTYYVFPRFDKPGYMIRAPKSCYAFFRNFGTEDFLPNLMGIDVSGLDVSGTEDFSGMFENVGRDWHFVDIEGLYDWNVNKPFDCSFMFCNFNSGVEGPIDLYLDKWNMESCKDFSNMFYGCGKNSNYLNITGLESWNIKNGTRMDNFLARISKKANFQIDLSRWNSNALERKPEGFTTNNFFRVKEPDWDQMIEKNKAGARSA